MKNLTIVVGNVGVMSNAVAALIQDALTKAGLKATVTVPEDAEKEARLRTSRLADARKTLLCEVSVASTDKSKPAEEAAKAETKPAAKADATAKIVDKRYCVVRVADNMRYIPSGRHRVMADIPGPVNDRDERRGLWVSPDGAMDAVTGMTEKLRDAHAVYVADMDDTGLVILTKAVAYQK